jgi:hypothetical protein
METGINDPYRLWQRVLIKNPPEFTDEKLQQYF